ncbi:hypothetical protein HUJ04_002094 [Dendroctonus ponderosae]|nr:hypothetical protein HUJ04_002094 [Dendroctonus ponderosae]
MVQIQESNFLLPARTPFAVVPLISQPLNDSRDSYLIIGFSIVGRIGVWIIAENGEHGSDFCHVSHHIIWNVAHPFVLFRKCAKTAIALERFSKRDILTGWIKHYFLEDQNEPGPTNGRLCKLFMDLGSKRKKQKLMPVLQNAAPGENFSNLIAEQEHKQIHLLAQTDAIVDKVLVMQNGIVPSVNAAIAELRTSLVMPACSSRIDSFSDLSQWNRSWSKRGLKNKKDRRKISKCDRSHPGDYSSARLHRLYEGICKTTSLTVESNVRVLNERHSRDALESLALEMLFNSPDDEAKMKLSPDFCLMMTLDRTISKPLGLRSFPFMIFVRQRKGHSYYQIGTGEWLKSPLEKDNPNLLPRDKKLWG